MQNDISRQWAFLTPFVPGEMLTGSGPAGRVARDGGHLRPRRSTATRSWAMGFCAAVTSRVQIASGIKIAFASNPFEIAMTAMDLDRLSGGRVVLGLGASIKNWVEGFHGMPRYEKPVARLRESIQVMREVFAKSHIPGRSRDLRRQFHNHDWRTFAGAFAPPVRETIPIWVAANQKGLTRLAGEVADGLHRPPDPRPALGGDPRPRRPRRGSGQGGPRPEGHPLELLAVGGGQQRPAGSPHDAKATVAFYAGHAPVPAHVHHHGLREGGRCLRRSLRAEATSPAGSEPSPTRWPRRSSSSGSADECRKRVEEVWDVADSFCLVPPIGGLAPEKIMFYIGGIAETFYS